MIKNEKYYCDMCEKVVKSKVVAFSNGVKVCKKHLNKLNYYK
jgi:hypothetical protein